MTDRGSRPGMAALIALWSVCVAASCNYGPQPRIETLSSSGGDLEVSVESGPNELSISWSYSNAGSRTVLIATTYLNAELRATPSMNATLFPDGSLYIGLTERLPIAIKMAQTEPQWEAGVGGRKYLAFEPVLPNGTLRWTNTLPMPLHLGPYQDAVEPVEGLRMGAVLPDLTSVTLETSVLEAPVGMVDVDGSVLEVEGRIGNVGFPSGGFGLRPRALRVQLRPEALECKFENPWPSVVCFRRGWAFESGRRGTSAGPEGRASGILETVTDY